MQRRHLPDVGNTQQLADVVVCCYSISSNTINTLHFTQDKISEEADLSDKKIE